ncbi:hypothetical protein WR25_10694 [Diploscapter pachys]|uniref:3-hydroxyacyl-CoA dehydrogenase C-terminal domain-containing protein n=1 Tax=Diploscapter pachys TaxID=2018661 RepID=A0A2A2K5W8_9BILA|nr:hypothetical protein WR25_10694 [Diploscapter pachys]
MTNVVIAGYARSPFHLAGKGALARVRPDDLAAQTIRGLIEKTGAIVERLDIKQALYAKLEQLKRPGTAVSSNTSTIPLGHLVDGRSDQFKADFLITHFFNPPRYMRLIEIVRGDHTDAAVAEKSLSSTLPQGDPYFDTVRPMPLVDKMIAEGFTGRKGKGGFYRFDKATKTKLALDLATGEYRGGQKPAPLPPKAEKDLGALIATPGKVGDYAWEILGKTLSYAAMLVGEAADDIVAIDDAMKLGYNWKFGPFELLDRIGAATFAQRLRDEGRSVPAILETAGDRSFYRVVEGKRQFLGTDGDYHDVVRGDGVLLLEDIKLRSEPLLKNASAAVWDVGDGVAALEFTTKMNALDGEIMSLIQQAIPLVQDRFKALVIYNEGSNFSAGANLGMAMFAAPEKPTFRLPGESGRTGIAGVVEGFRKKGMATEYDEVVSGRLATVLTGGEADLVDTVQEDDLLTLERAAFMEAVRDPRTQARVQQMLTTGKPLRN